MDAKESKIEAPKWALVIGVMLMALLEALDTTVVNVALPHMKGSFSATSDQITWMITAYLVSTAIVMPLTGYLVRKFGRAEVLLVGAVGFVLASVACGFADSLLTMVVFRFIQGGLGAVVVPISQSIILDAFSDRKRGQAMAIWGIAIMVGPLIGPVVGGWITENYSWPWVFFINVPIGGIAVYLMLGTLPFSVRDKVVKTDWLGIFFLSAALASLQLFLDQGQTHDWFDSDLILFLAWFFMSTFALFIFFAVKKPDESIIDLRLFKDKNFVIGNVLMVSYGMAMYSTIVLLPLMAQEVLSYPADLAGWILTPRGAVSAVVMFLIGSSIFPKLDSKNLMVTGLCLSFFAAFLMSRYPMVIDTWGFILPGIIMGIGMACVWSQLSTVTFKNIPMEKTSEAAGIFNVMRIMGGSIGIAITSAYLVRREQFHWRNLSENVHGANKNVSVWLERSGSSVPDANFVSFFSREFTEQVELLAYNDAFFFITIIFLFMIPLPLFLEKNSNY